MVSTTQVLHYALKMGIRKFLRSGLIDSMCIHVKGGPGGMGFPRYGGIGGNGGNVYLTAKTGLTLAAASRKLRNTKLSAGVGSNSMAKRILGQPGKDMTINVPVGVTVYDKHGIYLGELNKPDTKLIVAKGGLGGCTETGFSGQKGEARTLIVDLKLIADVSLVGFPNAGKSTLLQALSKSRTKIAEYAFTTLKPHIGILEYRDLRQISVADLPGLIEGAHINIGMGHKFLKHVERTKLLLFVIDIQGFQLSAKHIYRNCLETIVLLNKELELYKPDLLERPAMLIVNKMDTKDAKEKYNEVKPMIENLANYVSQCPEEIRPEKVLTFEHIMSMTAALRNKEEIITVKERIRYILDKIAEEQKFRLESKFSELELVENIQKKTKQIAPTLV